MSKSTAKKWIRTKADKKAVKDGCYFDVDAAERVVEFFKLALHHSKGKWAGMPFIMADWEKFDITYPVFGWMRPNGTRRFRVAYIEVPKKQGKSTYGSGCGLYLLVGDNEQGAEVYTAATKRDQAAIIHGEAVRMVKASPNLYKRLKLNETTKTISYLATQSKYAALASDSEGSEGINWSGLNVDELHAWSNRKFWDTLEHGGAARSQPLMLITTTAGVSDITTIGWQIHEYATKVLSGEFDDPEFFAYIRTAPMDMRLDDPKAHALANPGLGDTIDPAEIMSAAKRATKRPGAANVFERYRLNRWVSQTVRWLSVAEWDACGVEVAPPGLVGRPCYGGLDLASRRDIAAFVLWFPPFEDEPGYLLPRFWVPEDSARTRQEESNQVMYQTWGEQGHITLTPGNTISFRAIQAQMIADGRKYDIRGIGADKWALEYLRQELEAEGCPDIDEYQMTLHEMSEPAKAFEASIADRTLQHDQNPVMRWMVGNVSIYIDANENIRPDKKHSTEKIDGISAAVVAIGRSMIDEGGSVYDTRGLIVIDDSED